MGQDAEIPRSRLVEEWEQEWRSAWGVRRGVGGMVACLPLALRHAGSLKGEFPPAGLGAARVSCLDGVAARGLHAVEWWGWSRELGMCRATVAWEWPGWSRTPSGKGRPVPPSERDWFPSLAKPPIAMGLPLLRPPRKGGRFPSTTKLERETWDDFGRTLPEGLVGEAWLLGELLLADRDEERIWNSMGLGHSPLSWLLGTLPTPGSGVDRGEAERRRRQMLRAMPAIFSLCHGALGSRGWAEFLGPLADGGESPLPDMARLLGTSQPVVRSLLRSAVHGVDGVHPLRLKAREEGDRSLFLCACERMPADLRDSLCASSSLAMAAARTLDRVAQSVRDLPLGSTRALAEVLAPSLRPHPRRGWSWLAEGDAAAVHLGDMLRDFREEVGWPLIARTQPQAGHRTPLPARAAAALLGLGLPRLLAASLRHMRGAVHAAEMGTRAGGGVEWPVPGPPALHPGTGIRLVFLPGQRWLDEEGAALGHCVASYGSRCRRRECAILSLRGPKGSPSSTAEIVLSPSGGFKVRQHHGAGNGQPPPADARALEWWMSEAAKPGSPWSPGMLARPHDRSGRWTVAERLGEGWRSPEASEFRWNRWRRILDVRASGFLELLDSMEARGLPLSIAHDEVRQAAADWEEEMELARAVAEAEAGLPVP